MRPIYENAQSLQNERMVMDAIETSWGVTCTKIPIKYGVECALMKGREITAWAEIKCRSCRSKDFPTYMISLDKIVNGLLIARMTARNLYLFVSWKDVTGFLLIDEIPEIGMGDRYQLRTGQSEHDPDDREPMCYFNINQFLPLTEESCHKGEV